MTNKIVIPIVIAFIFICGFFIYEISTGNMEEIIFDQMTYNYTSHVWIPPGTQSEGSLGGYYRIDGKGRNFNFHIVMPGAEKVEHPECYDKNGLTGNGTIEEIDITYQTVYALLSGDFLKAMFETKFSGLFDMRCAFWTGYGNFTNDGKNFTGNFMIIGPLTDWEGKFSLVPENNRITVKSDYIYYPHGQKSPDKIKRVTRTIYM